MVNLEPIKLIHGLGCDRATFLFLAQLRAVFDNKIETFMDPQEVEKFINVPDK